MDNSLGHSQPNQLKIVQIKGKRKSWKEIMPIRKSARLTKISTPFVVKTIFLDDECYHGDLEDNETLEGEILENLAQPFKNKSQLVLYHPLRYNNMNLSKDKLRLIQEFIRHFGVFYRFTRDPTIMYSYEFLTVSGLKLSLRTLLNELIFFLSILIDHNRTAHGLSLVGMDRSWPISTMESHVNFCMFHHDQNSFIPKVVK